MPTFANKMSDAFPQEVDEANQGAFAHGYENGLGPYVAQFDRGGGSGRWTPTDGFTRMVENSGAGRKFKWTLNTRGDLAVLSPSLKHSVAAGGGDVVTAGHGWLAGRSGARPSVTLNNDTGHYQASEASLKQAVRAWEALGYAVVTQAFKDPKQALQGMF